jgi:putative DNA primase/helicase
MRGTDVSVARIAQAWQQAGVSVLPIPANQSKRPDRKWAQYTVTAPTLEEVTDWWGNGHSGYGIAVICGAVSGGVEMTELEGKATNAESLARISERMDVHGIGHLWDFLTGPNGFSEMSPSGGIHLLYRIQDAPVPGNTKIARRPATAEELLERPGDRIKVLAETRGEGGYVVTAPSPGTCHPSGEPWVLLTGQYGVLPYISWDERCQLHQALFEALDEMPEVAPPPVPAALPNPPSGSSAAGSTSTAVDLRPGDRWAAQTTFGEILEPAGWTLSHRAGEEEFWVRPGKNPRDGHSATVNYQGSGLLYVFSTAVDGLESERSYTKFGAYASLHWGGDMRRAAQELAANGWGTLQASVTDFAEFVPAGPAVAEAEPVDETYSLDELGNSLRLTRKMAGEHHYLKEEKCWYFWNGRQWEADSHGFAAGRCAASMTDDMLVEARRADNAPLLKWAGASRSENRLAASVKLARQVPGVAISSTAMNPQRHLLNVANGVLDLRDGTLHRHDKAFLMTRMFGAAYDPRAECPEFEAFMERALPDPVLRAYVQRALGYSLLGDADQRSIFLIHGPSGTGKSTLMETIREVFGEYGATAAASTFKASDRGTSPSPDLHGLRGKRFVTTSETSAGALFDEDLIKRLSGRDRIQSRGLYQDFVEWTPECAAWLATNNPPKFNSDDDAIWRRAKLIPFLTVFVGEGERPDMARSVLTPERDGILNWLLAGLWDYQANGLMEPEQVRVLVAEYRSQSDPVARFVEDQVDNGILEFVPGSTIRASEIFSMYLEWSRGSGEKPLGPRRFHNRLQSNYLSLTHEKSGHTFWRGLQRVPGVSILGTIS